jgi:hypothetical protein
MGAQPGDCGGEGTFTLLNHVQENLTVEEQIDRFSDYFIRVSQEFPPLEMSQLSDETRQRLAAVRPEDIPTVQEHEIFQLLDKSKRKKSAVPGDMPPRLFYDASAGLAAPAARIMNQIAQTGEWPKQYQTEWGVPLEKQKQAADESQSRLISCTNKMNIVFEKQVVRWLMQCVEHKLDPDQFGGRKGTSISHYLIEMTNFILYNQDLKDPQATIGLFVDYKQGFNRCQHSIFIEILARDYDVPGWLLRILVGYLTGRQLRVRYKQKIGEARDIFGGGGQGTPLGMWIFLFMIDKAGPAANEKPLGKVITEPINKRQKIEKSKQKWVDDFTTLAAVDLKGSLVEDTRPDIPRPVPYRSRTGHILPREENILQDELDKIKQYSDDRKMKLNPIKTKIMIFNPLRNHDVLPLLTAEQGEELEVVEQHKILGQIVRSDMRTISNTENICSKAYKRMWVLRRLKGLGCPTAELVDVLKQQIVSVCEVAAPYWGPMLSKAESNSLERCLKTGLHIIFQNEYKSFKNALSLANMQSLRDRRMTQIVKFSKQAIKSNRFNGWFCPTEKAVDQAGPGPALRATAGRRPAPLLRPVPCRTQRYRQSALPVMTELLSWHPPLAWSGGHLIK